MKEKFERQEEINNQTKKNAYKKQETNSNK